MEQEIDGEAGEIPARYRHCVFLSATGKMSQIASLIAHSNDLRSSSLEIEASMKYEKSTSHRGLCRRALVAHAIIAFGLLSFVHAASEEPHQEQLDQIVVSALRIPRNARDVASIVAVFNPRDWEKRGISQLRQGLNESPGVIATSTGGQTGALGSVFIRGTNTAYSQLVVDGIRLSDSTTQLGNMLAAARTFDLGRVEVLRGAQGAAYGGESIGGVLWLETTRGEGKPRGTLFAEAGSFDSYQTSARHQGELGTLSYFVSGSYEETQNDAPQQNFHQGSMALRLEQSLDSDWKLGISYRGVDSFFNNLGNSEDRVDASLVTTYLHGAIQPHWKTYLLTGHHQEFYDSDSQYGNYGTDMRATSFVNDHEITLSDSLTLLCGLFAHRSDFVNTIGTDAARDRYGLHLGSEWQSHENWRHFAAMRWEDYDAYGQETTWRIGSAYAIAATQTTLRTGLGSSFRAPSYLDLFGSSFGSGNPHLRAESSLGWDCGIEQKWGKKHRAQMVYFLNHISDRIDSFASPRPRNLDQDARAEGVEIALQGRFFADDWQYRLAYTRLLQSLSNQPEHALNASVDWQATEKWLCGAGLQSLSAHSWGGTPLDGYIVARLHGSYQYRPDLRLHVRWENVADESYLLSNFYGTPIAGAGSGVFAGITWDW
ncbi:MAG: hypothetical protein RLZZ224_1800 [Verrucomicrobiota bacterium]